ncbi:MAG TPA: RNA methyltransferase [Pseudomonadales bacterium]|nr:RNA methyltransferase [Pseudomonadales bacterium]
MSEKKPFEKKPLPDDLFTLYGRQSVLEALKDESILPYKLHLADSNRTGGTLADIMQIAEKKQIPLAWHSRLELSRISRNGKQDQGIALDIRVPSLQKASLLHAQAKSRNMRLLALDQITNPQNVGMILRSAAAGELDGVIIPRRGCARLDALVIKASAGTFFRTPIFACDTLPELLEKLQQEANTEICLMEASAQQSLFAHKAKSSVIYVLGNETEGVSAAIQKIPHTALSIAMANGVESLNVAMTATLIAYRNKLCST